MKRVIAMSAAALMGASLLASPVLAQVSIDTGLGVGVQAGDGQASGTVGGTGSVSGTGQNLQIESGAQADVNADIDTDTTAAVGASFDGALSAMRNNSSSASSISSMTQVSSVNVVRINDLEGADMNAFATAETENQASIDELHSSISGNAELRAALEAQSIDPNSVVAADVAADGSLTVYVR